MTTFCLLEKLERAHCNIDDLRNVTAIASQSIYPFPDGCQAARNKWNLRIRAWSRRAVDRSTLRRFNTAVQRMLLCTSRMGVAGSPLDWRLSNLIYKIGRLLQCPVTLPPSFMIDLLINSLSNILKGAGNFFSK